MAARFGQAFQEEAVRFRRVAALRRRENARLVAVRVAVEKDAGRQRQHPEFPPVRVPGQLQHGARPQCLEMIAAPALQRTVDELVRSSGSCGTRNGQMPSRDRNCFARSSSASSTRRRCWRAPEITSHDVRDCGGVVALTAELSGSAITCEMARRHWCPNLIWRDSARLLGRAAVFVLVVPAGRVAFPCRPARLPAPRRSSRCDFLGAAYSVAWMLFCVITCPRLPARRRRSRALSRCLAVADTSRAAWRSSPARSRRRGRRRRRSRPRSRSRCTRCAPTPA